MRWLFLTLLALNLIVAVWHQQRVPPMGTAVGPVAGYETGRDPVRLLSEAPQARREPALGVPEQSASCLFLGVLEQEATARLLLQRLLSLDINARLMRVQESAGEDYWVYLQPLGSRDAALRLLRELQSRNIDSYIITVGELANGISLGIFSQRATAQAVASTIAESGYAAQIRNLSRVQNAYWLRVASEDRRLVDERVMNVLLAQQPSLVRRQKPCDSVATL